MGWVIYYDLIKEFFMQKSKNAFTMVELVFVIVILGILAAVAIPRLAATRVDAEITKGIADVSSIRSAIVTERQGRLITGTNTFIANGTGADQMDENGLFGGVLTYPLANTANTNGKWSATAGSGTYVYRIGGVDTTFTYASGTGLFTCATSTYCSDLTD